MVLINNIKQAKRISVMLMLFVLFISFLLLLTPFVSAYACVAGQVGKYACLVDTRLDYCATAGLSPILIPCASGTYCYASSDGSSGACNLNLGNPIGPSALAIFDAMTTHSTSTGTILIAVNTNKVATCTCDGNAMSTGDGIYHTYSMTYSTPANYNPSINCQSSVVQEKSVLVCA